MKLSKLTVALLSAVMAAALTIPQAARAAAKVEMYGRADTGLVYTHVKGGDDTLEMRNGRSTPRWGFNMTEDLGNGWKVKGYLEAGYYIDTGANTTSGKLFDRRSILAVDGPYGELGAGRAGTVQSTVAPYSMGLLRYDPFGTSYGNASIGSTFANSSRVSNGLHYRSPSLGGFHFGASYSLGDTDNDSVEWNDKNHTFALAGNYQSKDLYLSLTFANVDSKHAANSRKPDARMYQLGGWWAVTPALKLFAGAGYQSNFSTGGKLSASKLDGVKGRIEDGGFNGESFLLGATYTIGKNKFIADAQYFTGKLARDHDVDFDRTVLAAAWEYWFSKKVIGYVAATQSFTSGKAEKLAQGRGGYVLEATQVFLGLDYHF